MDFKEVFREKFRVTLHAARENNEAGVIAGLAELFTLFTNQYNKNNGDSIRVKANLSYWRDAFGNYLQIMRQHGLKDNRIRQLFGLVDNISPSFSGDLKREGDTDTLPIIPGSNKQPICGINIEGLLPPEPIEGKASADPAVVEPVVLDPITPTEMAPIAPIMEGDKKDEQAMYTPNALRTFIGQQHIVKVLLKEIAIAKNEGRKHLDNILLFGNPGLGKTTLMELIAKELGVKFELLDCSQFRNSQQSLKALQNFFMRVANDNQPVVIALDEIHMLNNELQSSLLTLLNNRVYVSPLDINGQCKRIPIEEFTFIAATTDDDKVLDTVKNRCLRLKFQMVDYTSDELSLIYKNKIAAKGLTITEEAIAACIPRSRGAIRYVNAIVEGLNSALYNDEGVRVSTNIDLEITLKYFEEKGIDPMGLEKKDLEILRVIGENSGAISADVLSARVGLETKKYLSEYERYLIKIGFISVSGRGRSLTEKAINYLKENKG